MLWRRFEGVSENDSSGLLFYTGDVVKRKSLLKVILLSAETKKEIKSGFPGGAKKRI